MERRENILTFLAIIQEDSLVKNRKIHVFFYGIFYQNFIEKSLNGKILLIIYRNKSRQFGPSPIAQFVPSR